MSINKDDELVLVVPSEIIFKNGIWQGLKKDNLDYYVDLIENNCLFKRRGDVENDPSFQQIIPYMLFSHEGKFFAYKYIKNAGETRLINNDYQLGVGGHINKQDIKTGGKVLEEGMNREWEEEVDFKGKFLQKKLVGILKDSSRPVEQVHLGLVYHFIGDNQDINVKEIDKMEGRLFDLKDIEENLAHSPWMEIVYKEYLSNLKNDHMIKHIYPGKFIVIEGLDGSGKSAQVDLVIEFLKNQCKEVVITKEPTMDSEAGRKIKQALKGEVVVDPFELQKLYVQDRKEHLENKVIPAIKEGKYVVSSRYAFSTFAYGHSDGLDVDELIKMNEQFLLPDLTVIVDVAPESCVRRIESRGEEKELFEKLEKLTRVNEVYQKIPKLFENVFMIDGERPISMVFEDIKNLISERLLGLSNPLTQIYENSIEVDVAPTEIEIPKEDLIKTKDEFEPLFDGLNMTEEERNLIKPFFTNLDRSVFAISFLPPEIIGALCSRTSRAKDDLRQVFLKEFTKPFLAEDTEYSKSLKALIDFLHVHPAEVIFSNPKAREFYITWLAQFGDDSIAQMAGSHLIYSGISQLAIKQIEDMRVGIAPIEKSTRYLDFSSKINGSYRYYTDPTLANMGLEKDYKDAMDGLFDTYVELMQKYMEFLKVKYPTEEEKVLKTKAFDTLRLLLPVSTLGQVAFFANGQSFEYMVNRCLDHNLGEVRWSAKSALEELSKIIPAFFRRVETEDAAKYRNYLSGRSNRIRETLKNINWNEEKEIIKEPTVKLLECDLDAENKIIAGLIFREVGEAFESVLGKVRQMSIKEKEEVLKSALQNRMVKYYKTPRAFENAYLRFEILMNIGAWRDLHRHRMHTQDRQLFTIYNGFDVPEGLNEAGLDKQFINAILKAEEAFKKIEKVDRDVAQYCVTMAHRVRFTQYQNLRSFFWEAELRTIPQGHPDYRKIEQDKVKLINNIYPLLSKYLLVDMNDYDFARRGDSAAIQRKEEELRKYFGTK